jgi:DNA repair exonuclease SbcCD ATPase subunit
MTMPADAPAWLRDVLTDLTRAQALAEQQLATLAAAQARTEDRLDRLAAAQEQTVAQLAALTASTERRFATIEAQLAQHGERLDRIDALLTRHDERLDRIEQRLDRHGDQLGRLEGWAWETRVRDRAASYLADVADRVQVLTPLERDRLLDPAVRDGRLSRDEARAVRLADFIASGVDPDSDAPRVLVAEISARVDAYDVQRAAERAALLGRLGTPALGVVVGQRIDREAQTEADTRGVRLIRAGT